MIDTPRLLGLGTELMYSAQTEGNDALADRIEALDLSEYELKVLLGAVLKGMSDLLAQVTGVEGD